MRVSNRAITLYLWWAGGLRGVLFCAFGSFLTLLTSGLMFLHLDIVVILFILTIVTELNHYRLKNGKGLFYEHKSPLIFNCFIVYDIMTFGVLMVPVFDAKVGQLARGEPVLGPLWANYSLLVLSAYLFNLSMCSKAVYQGFGHQVAGLLANLAIYVYLLEEWQSHVQSPIALSTNMGTTAIGVLEASHYILVPLASISYPMMIWVVLKGFIIVCWAGCC